MASAPEEEAREREQAEGEVDRGEKPPGRRDPSAIGAVGEASNATGINGNQADNSVNYAGAVYIY